MGTRLMRTLWLVSLVALAGVAAYPQAPAPATFGTRITAPGNLLDIVLDEQRQRLYLVNFANDRVEIYSIAEQRLLGPIQVGSQPVSAAMSPDGQYLYVTNFGSSTLTVIDLGLGGVTGTVTLVAPPEGVAVGSDGRVLITTLGTGAANNPQNTLLLFDARQTGPAQLAAVPVPPPAPQNPTLAPFIAGRPFLSFRGRLQTTPDGNFIIGMNSPTANSTVVFVHEVASGTVLRVRLVPGLSTVMSVSPDGSRFMAGLRLFETATLNMLATTSAANAAFQVPAAFNANQNVGGSVFSADGGTLYSAFNVQPFALPQPRPNSALLLVSNPRNLGINLGIRLPESVLGKMVATSDGSTVYAVSESGVLRLPVGRIYESPILMPETTAVRLSINPCDRGLVTADVKVSNIGKGKLTFTFAQPGQGLLAQAVSGLAPSTVRLSLNPRITNRLPGTTTFNLQLTSNEAINIPPIVRVYQNFQTGGQVGETIPLEIALTGVEGLVDLQVDNRRGRIYMANSGLNRVDVYDFRNRKVLPSIEVGQFPRSMAMTSDGSLLYVANSGGESISIVDLDSGRQSGKAEFPAVPFNFNQNPVTPRSIAMGIFGPQFVGSNGSLWSVRGASALPRAVSPVIGAATVASPANMVSAPGNESIVLMNNTGVAFRYDSISDTYVNAQTVMSAPIDSYYGPLAAGPGGRYFLANRAILNSTLVPIGGRTTGGGAQFTFPPQPGQPPVGAAGAVTQGLRHQPAVAAINDTTYARFTIPPQANAGTAPVGDPRPLVEVVEVLTENRLVTVAAPEGPPAQVFGNLRANINPRMMAVDSSGSNAFLVTMSGLSIVSLRQPLPAERPAINNNGVVHGATFSRSIAPGSLISIFGRNLGETARASSLPLPEILGGSCVTFNDVTLPLLSTSPTQINAQLPPDALPGANAVMVHSVVTGLESVATLANVSRSAPGVFALDGNLAALFHGTDMRPVTRANPALREEVLVLFATGLPAADGSLLAQGVPAPANPLVTTVPPRVFIGDPDTRGSEMIIEWSGFTPGFIGLNQINLRVPASALTGDNLPVVVRVDDGESPRAGPLVPVTSVR